jgi:hypothetical protein
MTPTDVLPPGFVGVIGAVWLIRYLLGRRFPALKTDRGGAVLVVLVSIAGAFLGALADGAAFSIATAKAAYVLGIEAAGSYSLVRKMFGGAGGSGSRDGDQPAGPASIPGVSP